MTKPITPREVSLGKHIPDEVFAAFNELIAEGGGVVRQDAVVKRIAAKLPGRATRTHLREGLARH